MISEYHRPNTLDEAMKLIARADPCTYPLGGGTVLNRPSPDQFAVVDLQALGLNIIHKNGNNLEIGATATLQALLDSPHISPALQIAIKLETTFNLRQMATVAGTLVACNGRSPFAAVMLALDAKLTLAPNEDEITLGNLLPFLKSVGVGLVPAQKGRPHRSPALACTCAGTSAQVQACRPGLAARTGRHRRHQRSDPVDAGARRQARGQLPGWQVAGPGLQRNHLNVQSEETRSAADPEPACRDHRPLSSPTRLWLRNRQPLAASARCAPAAPLASCQRHGARAARRRPAVGVWPLLASGVGSPSAFLCGRFRFSG